MANSLSKGQKADITRTNEGLEMIIVGIGWDAAKVRSGEMEIDGAAFLLGSGGKCPNEQDFVFYGNETCGSGGAVKRSTVNTSATKDKEQFMVNFSKIPGGIEKVSFTLTIYDADKRKQDFSAVSDIYIRVATPDGNELLRYDIGNCPLTFSLSGRTIPMGARRETGT